MSIESQTFFVLKVAQKWHWDQEKPYNENKNQLALAGFCGRSYGYFQLFDDEETIKQAIKDFYPNAEYFTIEV